MTKTCEMCEFETSLLKIPHTSVHLTRILGACPDIKR